MTPFGMFARNALTLVWPLASMSLSCSAWLCCNLTTSALRAVTSCSKTRSPSLKVATIFIMPCYICCVILYMIEYKRGEIPLGGIPLVGGAVVGRIRRSWLPARLATCCLWAISCDYSRPSLATRCYPSLLDNPATASSMT